MFRMSDAIILNTSEQKIRKQNVRDDRSASKSPRLNSKITTLTADPTELFQRLCCPNCKYIFKIIKNTDVLQKHNIAKKSVLSQTDQYSITNKDSPSILLSPRNQNFQKNTQSQFLFHEYQRRQVKNQIKKMYDPLKSDLNAIELKKKLNNLISNNLSEDMTKTKKIDLNDSGIFFFINKSKNEKINNQDKANGNEQKDQIKTFEDCLRSLLVNEYEIYLENSELCQHLTTIPNEIEIPAFCKMMIKKQLKKG